MATRYSSVAWKIPWTEKPDGLQSIRGKKLDITEQLSMHAQPCTGEVS